MNIDKGDWHRELVEEDGLPEESASVHIGMFVSWAINNGLYGSDYLEEHAGEGISKVKNKQLTGNEFIIKYCGASLAEDDLYEEPLAFAKEYFPDIFFDDYDETLGKELNSLYEVEDNWENAEKFAKVLNKRYEKWKRRRAKSWWQFW